jgi:stage V sporulation protein G
MKGNVLNITNIRIRRTYQDSRLRALVSLTLEGEFAVHDIKVIDGPERLFVAMPSRRDEQGVFRDICHPITASARRELEDSILGAYRAHMEEAEAAAKQSHTLATGHE